MGEESEEEKATKGQFEPVKSLGRVVFDVKASHDSAGIGKFLEQCVGMLPNVFRAKHA